MNRNYIIGIFGLFLFFHGCQEPSAKENLINEESQEGSGKMPNNVKNEYPLTKDVFKLWFEDDTISREGKITPANSLNFSNSNNSDFYKWSYRMFLWITSKEKNGMRVFDSQTFYDVAPESGPDHMRKLIKHEPGVYRNFSPKLLQTGNKTIGLDEVEQGQAGGADVLMTKNGSLVYYTLMVNDVMAVFRTKTNGTTPMKFPDTQAEIDELMEYGKSELGVDIKDGDALAMELKLSWVESKSLKNASDYIEIEAIIPEYQKNSDNTTWKSTGKEVKTKLALVGMHVVGNAKGHPEMLWATFEHKDNAPAETYAYETTSNQIDTIGFTTEGEFVFCENKAKAPFNIPHMGMQLTPSFYATDTIVAKKGKKISPSNTSRVNPWGAVMGITPNPLVQSAAQSNSEILSLNYTVESLLIQGDLRKNYMLLGCTWTNNGGYPYSASGSVDGGKVNYPRTGETKVSGLGAAVGTSRLANSTMETYHQDMNCFNCHNNFTNVNTVEANEKYGFTGLSHIFSNILKLDSIKKSTTE